MEIRPIKIDEWPKLKKFYFAEYGENHILTDKNYIDWQYDSFTNNNQGLYSALGAFDMHNNIQGVCGSFVLPYSYYGNTIEGNCLTNLIVSRKARGMGLGYLLLEQAANIGDFCIDHGASEATLKIMKKTGWSYDNLSRYIFVINPRNALFELPESQSVDISSGKTILDIIKIFNTKTDEFWHRIKKRYSVTVERISAYLNWRYANNPLVHYEQFALRESSVINAIAIIRIEEVKKEKPIGVRVARIIDFFSDPRTDTIACLKIVEWCKRSGIDFIDYFSSGNFHREGFELAGFVNAQIEPWNSIPILFNPVSLKRTQLNFSVKSRNTVDLADWYTTKGGGDQDRLR